MAFDYKKEYPRFYAPGKAPELVEIPKMNFVAVDGCGNPNEEGGAYSQALGILYAISYTLKMSDKAGHPLKGAFPYVVPPLEGLWRMADGTPGVDYSRKEAFTWCSLIRLPDFVTEEDLAWAKETAAKKKKLDTAPARFFPWEEGLSVQCMHHGSYDSEPATLAALDAYATAEGYRLDFSQSRMHHEIYLGDPRRTAPEKLRTILRHPVKKED